MNDSADPGTDAPGPMQIAPIAAAPCKHPERRIVGLEGRYYRCLDCGATVSYVPGRYETVSPEHAAERSA